MLQRVYRLDTDICLMHPDLRIKKGMQIGLTTDWDAINQCAVYILVVAGRKILITHATYDKLFKGSDSL